MKFGKRNRRVIIAHQYWGRGGAESAAMWIIEALVREYEVTIYTSGGFDIDDLNTLAGTRISADHLIVRQADICSLLPFGAFRSRAFMNSLFHVGSEFDLRITASGILPWGRASLQFLSSVEWNPVLTQTIDPDRKLALRERVSRWIMNSNGRKDMYLPGNMFVANSKWLKDKCQQFLTAPIHIVHPVLPSLPEAPPSQRREESVLVFGRISPEKRIEDAIQIVELSRTMGFKGRLVIAGPDGASEYAAYIRTLASDRDWIEMLPTQTGLYKEKLLQQVKYGLNTCRIEAFGISTAEMAASGVITLVPRDTGQCEIIVNQQLQFESIGDAACKLVAISDGDFYEQLSQSCSQQVRSQFSIDNFISTVQEIAELMLRRE